MTKMFQFCTSFLYIPSLFLFIGGIEKYAYFRLDNMFARTDKGVFEGIEDVDEYAIVLLRERTEMRFSRKLQAIGEYEYQMISDSFLTEVLDCERKRRFSSLILLGKQHFEILMYFLDMLHAFFSFVCLFHDIRKKPSPDRIVVLSRRKEQDGKDFPQGIFFCFVPISESHTRSDIHDEEHFPFPIFLVLLDIYFAGSSACLPIYIRRIVPEAIFPYIGELDSGAMKRRFIIPREKRRDFLECRKVNKSEWMFHECMDNSF